MTLKIELAASVESGLLAQARAQGLSIEEYAGHVLEERSTSSPAPARKKTLLELFEPLRGLDMEISQQS